MRSEIRSPNSFSAFVCSQDELRRLRREGNQLTPAKLGRRGVCPDVVTMILSVFHKRECILLRCDGRPSANMKLLAQELEDATGGLVIHRTGKKILLYRGQDWGERAARSSDA